MPRTIANLGATPRATGWILPREFSGFCCSEPSNDTVANSLPPPLRPPYPPPSCDLETLPWCRYRPESADHPTPPQAPIPASIGHFTPSTKELFCSSPSHHREPCLLDGIAACSTVHSSMRDRPSLAPGGGRRPATPSAADRGAIEALNGALSEARNASVATTGTGRDTGAALMPGGYLALGGIRAKPIERRPGERMAGHRGATSPPPPPHPGFRLRRASGTPRYTIVLAGPDSSARGSRLIPRRCLPPRSPGRFVRLAHLWRRVRGLRRPPRPSKTKRKQMTCVSRCLSDQAIHAPHERGRVSLGALQRPSAATFGSSILSRWSRLQ